MEGDKKRLVTISTLLYCVIHIISNMQTVTGIILPYDVE